MGFLSNLFHRKQSVADYDKLVSKHKINQYQGESYIHWNKRACKCYLDWAREMFMAIPRYKEQYLFNLEGIVCYLSAASYAAASGDQALVKQILMELSTKKVLIEDTVYYDDFQFEVSEYGYYWEIYKDYIETFKSFDGVNCIMFLKEWDLHTKRPIYKKPIHKPIAPIKEAGESDLYFAFRKMKFNKDKINWEELKKSPMPTLPTFNPNNPKEKQIRLKEYEVKLNAWKEARADLENDKKLEKIKEQRKIEQKMQEFKRKINDKNVFGFEKEKLLDEYRIKLVDIKLINVYSYGRMKDSFGKYGYSMTNPICIKHFAQNGIGNYLQRIMFDFKKVSRYDIITFYEVSNIKGSIVKEVVVEFEDLKNKINLFFAENCLITKLDLPSDIDEYREPVDWGGIKINLRLPPKDYDKMALVKYEESATRPFTYKVIWKNGRNN